MTSFEPNQEMLHNYIQNKLSPADTEQLELWLADHPDVMGDLEMDLMFKQGVVDELEEFKDTGKTGFNILDLLSSRTLVPVHLLAYGLMAVLFVNMVNNQNIPQNLSATFIELEKTRGSEVPTIEINHTQNKGIAIRFFPDSTDQEYKVILNSQVSNQKFVFDQLQADELGSITLMLNPNKGLAEKWQVEIFNGKDKLEQTYVINMQ